MTKSDIGGTGCSENSDVTHSNPIYFLSFKNANVIKIDIEGKGYSQNSDVTHSKTFRFHSFFNVMFASLYLMRL